jgi:squalene/oxidosqualene cyclase-like protein
MHAEDLETNYLTIGPVSKAMQMVCTWVREGGELDAKAARSSKSVQAHIARVPAYLWVAEDGMKVQGYNGSMAWDTAFAMQACVESKLQEEFPDMCAKAFGWFVREQVRALPDGDWRHWRQAIRGGWGFSTAEQAWPVSDTTAEAFLAVLALRGKPCVDKIDPMPDEHYFDAVQFLLSYQNDDGGWATYESRRGWKWYEKFNPSEVFGDIMIDYSYVECSSSSIGALRVFSEHFPNHRRREIDRAIQRGGAFIKAMQRDDGSWYGCWGNCFTYGCWFGVDGLLHCGECPSTSSAIQRCNKFLLSKQNDDGGWGEDFASCFNKEYTAKKILPGSDSGSTVVQTAWALLALMAGECGDTAAVRRGVEFLMRRQLPSGDWPQENIAGVFNRSVGITYTAFRNVFPLWALGRFARDYGPKHGLQKQ